MPTDNEGRLDGRSMREVLAALNSWFEPQALPHRILAQQVAVLNIPTGAHCVDLF